MRLRRDQKLIDWLHAGQPSYVDLDTTQPLSHLFAHPDQLLLVEIGCGKGDFCVGKALGHPNMNYLGIEKYDTPLAKAVKKANRVHLDNLLFSVFDADQLDNPVWYKSVYKIFLNFSDPWPKKRHTKKRLTSPNFLAIYEKLLVPNGVIEFKTDNDSLFQYTMEEVLWPNPDKYHVIYWTNDLHAHLDEPVNSDNVMTEYEKKFTSLGAPIHKVVFSFVGPEGSTHLTPSDSKTKPMCDHHHH